jgi:hypothetical protein
MRALVLLGALGALVIGACSSSGGNRVVVIDCSDSGATVDAGVVEAAAPPSLPPLSAPLLTQLRAGEGVELLGVTTGAVPYAVYNVHVPNSLPDTWSLEVAPVYSGVPIVLATGLSGNDGAIISGGAVAWYQNADPTLQSADSISFWSVVGGSKTVKTTTIAGTFAASEDGASVAFGANGSADGTHIDIVVTSSADPSVKSPALTGKFAVNLADFSVQCTPHLAFGGQTAFATYCTGTTALGNPVRLFSANAGAAGSERLAQLDDLSDVIDAIKPSPAADRVYVHTLNGQGLVLFFDGDNTTTKKLGPIDVGYPNSDVTQLYAATAGTLKEIDLNPTLTTTPLGPTDVLVLIALSKDAKKLLYAKNVGAVIDASDLYLFDIASKTTSTVTAAPNAVPVGFSGDGSTFLYVDKVQPVQNVTSGHRGTLTALPLNGGAATTLQAGVSQVSVAPEGSGLIVVMDEADPVETLGRETLSWVDVGKPQPPSKIATIVQGRQGFWSHKSFVFEDLGATPGIYSVEVP